MSSSKNSKPLRVGIIGAGGIARDQHIPGYQKVEGVEIAAVCDVREDAARHIAQKHNIPNVYRDFRKMLRKEKLDAVSVCTPNAFHMDPTIAALRSGVHVLCEKPIALNARQGEAMCAEARKVKRILMVGLHMRFSPSAKMLKQFIQDGELGHIYYARAQALRRGGVPSWGVFIEKDKSGGGPLIDIGVHILDLALWLMGHPEPVSVTGNTYCYFGNREGVSNEWGKWDPKRFTVEDTGMGFVRFKNGMTLCLETSWKSHIDEDLFKVSFLGMEGGAVTEPLRVMRDKRGTMVDITPQRLPKVAPHAEEIREFVEAIREGKPSPVPGEEALMTTRILDGIYASAKKGKEIRL